MSARRDKQRAKRAGDAAAVEAARARVDAAKHGLGERGPVWWDDGAPDLTRHLARTTVYAPWSAALPEATGPADAAGTGDPAGRPDPPGGSQDGPGAPGAPAAPAAPAAQDQPAAQD